MHSRPTIMTKVTTREIRERLATNRARVAYWGRLMEMEPLDRGSQGRDAVYTTRDLFSYLLCQRLFESMGMSVTVSARIVAILRKKLTKDQMQRMKSLNLVVSTTKPRASANLIGYVEMNSHDHKQKRKRGYLEIRRRKSTTNMDVIARLEVSLTDLHKKAEKDN